MKRVVSNFLNAPFLLLNVVDFIITLSCDETGLLPETDLLLTLFKPIYGFNLIDRDAENYLPSHYKNAFFLQNYKIMTFLQLSIQKLLYFWGKTCNFFSVLQIYTGFWCGSLKQFLVIWHFQCRLNWPLSKNIYN